MIYTEDEAKTKWCPFVRMAVPSVSSGINRIYQAFKEWADGYDRNYMEDQENNCKCIGAECMAWRWLTINQHGTGVSIGREADIAAGPKSKGYCGLAGGIGK